MTFDLSDFRTLSKDLERKKIETIAPQLQLLKQGAVVAELLPGVPAWDTFLSYIQGAIDTTKGQYIALQDMLSSPSILDADKLLQIKVNALRCAERIAAWEAVLGLPKELIESGTKATDLLTRMETLHADDRRASEPD